MPRRPAQECLVNGPREAVSGYALAGYDPVPASLAQPFLLLPLPFSTLFFSCFNPRRHRSEFDSVLVRLLCGCCFGRKLTAMKNRSRPVAYLAGKKSIQPKNRIRSSVLYFFVLFALFFSAGVLLRFVSFRDHM